MDLIARVLDRRHIFRNRPGVLCGILAIQCPKLLLASGARIREVTRERHTTRFTAGFSQNWADMPTSAIPTYIFWVWPERIAPPASASLLISTFRLQGIRQCAVLPGGVMTLSMLHMEHREALHI